MPNDDAACSDSVPVAAPSFLASITTTVYFLVALRLTVAVADTLRMLLVLLCVAMTAARYKSRNFGNAQEVPLLCNLSTSQSALCTEQPVKQEVLARQKYSQRTGIFFYLCVLI